MSQPAEHRDNVQRIAKAIPLRFVTAASLFDGHDASINIMRRILQSAGVEVIHLGHNRSVGEIVSAAIQEDADAIAVSSYQGGHMEYFQYMVSMLAERDSPQIRVFGGGGGVIVREEIEALHAAGMARVYSPDDGQQLGLRGMIEDMITRCCPVTPAVDLEQLTSGEEIALARVITRLSNTPGPDSLSERIDALLSGRDRAPVIGITGTGGAGKSSITDEIVRRFRVDQTDRLKIAVIAVDPSRRKSGGALLGDRIRMNAIDHPNIFMRSLATRDSGSEVPRDLPAVINTVQLAGYDIIIVETSGIGQGDAEIAPLVDLSLYVMTPEYGAASQLEKIDMLDFADVVVINKFDRRGGKDALRDVRKQLQRNTEAFDTSPEQLPVFGTIASRFNDDGVNALYTELVERLSAKDLIDWRQDGVTASNLRTSSSTSPFVDGSRQRYLAEIAESVRAYRQHVLEQSRTARICQQLRVTRDLLEQSGKQVADVSVLLTEHQASLDQTSRVLLDEWPELKASYRSEELVSVVRDKEIRSPLRHQTLSGTSIPRVALPDYEDEGEILKWLGLENVPGRFPYTAGVFPLKRESEEPSRMFAGEGDAFKTNKRFKYLSKDAPAKRLSTAFDSVTLYGFDPDERPDIYGKVGNSGVSIATLDDMRALYDGFDLCAPSTSVSMTINGPAPTILAMFLNAAIDQEYEKFERTEGRQPNAAERAEVKAQSPEQCPRYGASRHPQRRPGSEHLYLLDRVQSQGDG